MAIRERKEREKLASAEDKSRVAEEYEAVRLWRQEQFVAVLRQALPDEEIDLAKVQALVDSSSSHHDLRELIHEGCDPQTAIEILI